MTLTDNELCMVEQLCYINPDLVKAVTGRDISSGELTKMIADSKGLTVGQLLDKLGFTDKRIEELADKDIGEIDGACAEPGEWASILSYLKNSELRDLKLTGTMPRSDGNATLALCFEQPGTPGAIVAFKGTTGEKEWSDNVEGLNVTETQCQKEALEFVESLPYDDLTVIGHSKGGNKAMYVTILCDKVSHCVAFDGQGFSKEFLDKYWAEIQLRGDKIWNYSVSTDYVHALLFQIPNANLHYCRGYGIQNGKQHHSPNSFFQTDKDGNLILDDDGKPVVFSNLDEDPSITMIHEFTAFLMNNAPADEKKMLVEYLAPIVGVAMGGSKEEKDKLLDMILADPDKLATLVAYLAKYMDEYDLSSEDLDKLLNALGLNSLNEMLTLKEFEVMGKKYNLNLNLSNIIKLIKGQLNDSNDDWFIANVLLPALKFAFAKKVDIDITEFWNKINSKVKEIDTSGGKGNYSGRTGEIRDYSVRVYDTLMDSIRRIEGMGTSSVSRWKNYSGESWYSSLLVSVMVKGLSTYFNKLTDTNQECKLKIERAFDDVWEIDRTYQNGIRSCVADLKTTRSKIAALADNLN